MGYDQKHFCHGRGPDGPELTPQVAVRPAGCCVLNIGSPASENFMLPGAGSPLLDSQVPSQSQFGAGHLFFSLNGRFDPFAVRF